MSHRAEHLLLLVCMLVSSLVSRSLLAAPEEPEEDEGEVVELSSALKKEQGTFKPPLQPLPTPPKRKLPPPTAEDRRILDELLSKLTSLESSERDVGLDQAKNVDESLLPAIRARIDKEADGADRSAMKRLLLDIRKTARQRIQREMRAAGNNGEVQTPDYLDMVVRYPKPDNPHWKKLVTVLGLSRMCVHIGSVAAVRVLIRLYVRFAFLRIDTQLQLKQLGDKALAALIEHTKHPAPEVSAWAKRQLDFFGKAIPSETVQVDDPQVLADILRAYGYVKDPNAARLIASFANSEQATVRQGAREAVVLLGEVGNWQLRDAYEKMVGQKPEREWGWDRTAKELFREFDTIRLSEVYTQYTEGVTALEKNDLETMRERFDKLLNRSPDFTPKDHLLKGYLVYAEKHFDSDREASADALAKVLRLTDDETVKQRAQSLLLTLEAMDRLDQNVADQTLLKKALALDPKNVRAHDLLEDIRTEPFVERSSFMRTFWPLLLSVLGLVAAIAVLLRRPSPTAS